MAPVKTDKPLLISITEAGFQLSLSEQEVALLIRDGELVAVKVRGQVLVVYASLTAFTRRAMRNSAVAEVVRVSA